MNNVKSYILSLLIAFVAVSVSAQDLPTNEKSVSQESKMVDTSSSACKIAQFEKSIAKRESVLKNNPKLKDNQRIESLKLSVTERDSIIFYQKKILAERADYESLKNRLATLEIYEFLGRRNADVFTAELPAVNIPLSACSRAQLSLIEKIRSVNADLTKISEKISDAKITGFANNNSVSKEEAKQFLAKSAENDLLKADEKMTEIDEMDLSVLSPEQQNFYKQTVTSKYRAVYKKIYP
jgi:hypothetical protein